MNPQNEIKPNQKTSRTLDQKPKNLPASQKPQKMAPANKPPPVKKKIIKFHFGNPFEYKMSLFFFFFLIFQKTEILSF